MTDREVAASNTTATTTANAALLHSGLDGSMADGVRHMSLKEKLKLEASMEVNSGNG